MMSITSGMTVTGGFRTIMRGCNSIIRSGLPRERKDTITTITNGHFQGLPARTLAVQSKTRSGAAMAPLRVLTEHSVSTERASRLCCRPS
jgi:hypothetical protein